jgi:hypothetical protein
MPYKIRENEQSLARILRERMYMETQVASVLDGEADFRHYFEVTRSLMLVKDD